MSKEKIWSVAKDVFTWALVIITVLMVIMTLVLSVVDGDDKKLFGVRMMTVLSDSMKATDFKAGDIIFVKDIDPSTLDVGDIVAYKAKSGDNKGSIITHKIKELTVDEDGNPGFLTYGTTTGVVDDEVVTYWDVIGKYTGKIAGVGYFFNYLKDHKAFTYIVFVLLPFSILIASQAVNSVKLFRQYKGEQKSEMDDERARLAAELEEARRMKEELIKMKAELESGRAAPTEKAPIEEKVSAPAPATAAIEEPETEKAADEAEVAEVVVEEATEAPAAVEEIAETADSAVIGEPEEENEPETANDDPEESVEEAPEEKPMEEPEAEPEAAPCEDSDGGKAERIASMKEDLKTVENEIVRLVEQRKAKKAAYLAAEGAEKAELYANIVEIEKTAKALMALRSKIMDQIDGGSI